MGTPPEDTTKGHHEDIHPPSMCGGGCLCQCYWGNMQDPEDREFAFENCFEEIAHYEPKTGDCGLADVGYCAGALAGTIAARIAAGFTAGLELVGCISAAIGTASTCSGCICAVLETMGISCGY